MSNNWEVAIETRECLYLKSHMSKWRTKSRDKNWKCCRDTHVSRKGSSSAVVERQHSCFADVVPKWLLLQPSRVRRGHGAASRRSQIVLSQEGREGEGCLCTCYG